MSQQASRPPKNPRGIPVPKMIFINLFSIKIRSVVLLKNYNRRIDHNIYLPVGQNGSSRLSPTSAVSSRCPCRSISRQESSA